ncbi:MAG TPA: site-specific integrase [Acetobacteraceae bacterium]
MASSRQTSSNRCRPLAEWPALDQAAWAVALHPGDALHPRGVTAYWAAATQSMIIKSYGRWLTWLDVNNMLDPLVPPEARVTTERLSSYIADLQGKVACFTVASRIEQLGKTMRAMAPERHWDWLQHMGDQLRAQAEAEQSRRVPLPPLTADGPIEGGAAVAAASIPAMSNRCRPLAEWPALDQTAWAAALQPGDVLDPGGVAAGWAEATRSIVIGGYGRWLTWLDANSMLDPLVPPAARVTTERLSSYLADLRSSVAPFTVAARIEQLGKAMRAMAPEQDWRWIQRAADRLRAGAVSVRDKRARMQSPEQLAALGRQLMAEAEAASEDPPITRATDFRDGLLIALLAHRPIRRLNLRSIIYGQHLVRRGEDWWLVFPASETKTSQALELPFPAELAPALERYMAQHRPVLLARGRRGRPATMALWISTHGTHMGDAAISHQIGARTKAAFGAPISPHLFRDCAATEIAISAPEHVQMIRPILGHTTITTSERHYNLAGSLEASRRYGQTITALRHKNQSGGT